MAFSTRRLSALAILVLGVLGAGVNIVAEPRLNWRARVLCAKALGHHAEIEWDELLMMLLPESGFHLDRLATTQNIFAVVENPFDSPDDIRSGQALFGRHCRGCHAPDAGAAGLWSRELRHGDSDWALYRAVSRGVPGTAMVGFDLTPREIWQTIAYVASKRDESLAERRRDRRASPTVRVTAGRLRSARAFPEDWLTYSGSYAGWRHTGLRGITRENVEDLQLVWARQLSGRDINQTSPIVVDGVMFGTGPASDVWAVDAATGDTLWTYARELPSSQRVPTRTNRGVAVTGSRVVVGTLDAHVIALDAGSGQLLFDTEVADHASGYSITSAPLAVDDKIVVGMAGGDWETRGFLDAYDAVTGARLWRFHTIPGPGQLGHDTWGGDSWKTGGGATWLTGSYDPELDLIYWGVGNPAPAFDGAGRPGDNLFTNSVIALDPDDGALVWHFQFTPHGEHDWDANQIPVLVDLEWEGHPRRLMMVANKNGFYYVLDRETGEFLLARPFAKQNWAKKIDPSGRPVLDEERIPKPEGTLTWPNTNGATSWWSPSYSPVRNHFYVPVQDLPQVFYKRDARSVDDGNATRLFQDIGYTWVERAPENSVKALDPRTGEIVWDAVLSVSPVGRGGILSTASDLLFLGDGHDFIALDSATGRELWRVGLGGRIRAAPISFAVEDRQMVAIAAGDVFYVFGAPG